MSLEITTTIPLIYSLFRDGYGGIACERVTPLTGRTAKQVIYIDLF